MVTQPIDLSDIARNGLQPNTDVKRNSPYAVTFKGLIPTEWGAKPLKSFTFPSGLGSLSMSWPHPQLIRADRTFLLANNTAISVLTPGGSWSAAAQTFYKADSQATTDTLGGNGAMWQAAGFQGDWFLTDGVDMVFKVAGATSNRTLLYGGSNESANVQFDAICNFNNRLVVGGMTGSTHFADSEWTALFDHWRQNSPDDIYITEDDAIGRNWIMWSEAGGGDNEIPLSAFLSMFFIPSSAVFVAKWKEYVYTKIEQGEIGFFPLKTCGNIRAIRQYEDDLIVYGAQGVSRLVFGPQPFQGETQLGFREVELTRHGCVGRGAVNGNQYEHLWVSTDGELYGLGQRFASYQHARPLGNGVFRLGYDRSDSLGLLTQGDGVLVVFDELEQYYWISDGTYCFCLTRTGLGDSIAVRPSSAIRADETEGLLGTAIDGADDAVRVVTETFDGGQRQAWEVQFVDVASTDTASSAADRWGVVMQSRFNKHDNFTSFSAVLCDDRGRSRVKAPGVEFRIQLDAADRTKADIDNIYVHPGRGKPSMRKWIDA